MTIVVEDGTGLSIAVSYGDVTGFRAYHAARGNDTARCASDGEVEYGLVRATDYIDMRFTSRARGCKVASSQALSWPREYAYDKDGLDLDLVPAQVVKALYEYALIALMSPDGLTPTPAVGFSTENAEGVVKTGVTGSVRRKSEKVGPIEEDTHYEQRNAADTHGLGNVSDKSSLVGNAHIREFPKADLIMETILKSSSHTTHLVRA